MSVFTSIGIIVFSTLILVFLQFVPGVFALFYHFLAGKFSKNRTEHTALFFILGAESAFAIILLLIYIFLNLSTALIPFFQNEITSWIIAGIMVALGIFFAISYFRPGPGTKLFISRSLAKQCQARINSTKTRLDAFLLGFTAVIPEFPFTLPLLLLSALAINIIQTNAFSCAALIILITLLSILPLAIIYVAFSKNSTLADFIKFRFKNKPFVRFIIPVSYFALAILIILGVTL